ncbi:hypothetical protein HYW99_01780, partial [Candidatus Woesearchaeota archaeon]|nr:hypothetical protein [Candidatus Woesearchaeota archaeon]
RVQFQPQLNSLSLDENKEAKPIIQQKKHVEIIDCRPEGERCEEFQNSSAKNAEPLKPRYGDYKSEDVSIDKFFYFGRK